MILLGRVFEIQVNTSCVNHSISKWPLDFILSNNNITLLLAAAAVSFSSSWLSMTFYTLTLFFIPMELMPITTRRKTSALYHWLNGFSNLPCGLYSLHMLLSFFSFLQTSGLNSMLTGLLQPMEAYLET